MTSLTRPTFWRQYASLDPKVRQAARRSYRLFAADPNHPSLNFEKLSGFADLWSVRISRQHRAIGRRKGDTIEWGWIGSHNEFDSRFS